MNTQSQQPQILDLETGRTRLVNYEDHKKAQRDSRWFAINYCKNRLKSGDSINLKEMLPGTSKLERFFIFGFKTFKTFRKNGNNSTPTTILSTNC